MRKSLTGIFLLLLVSIQLKAQKEVLFKVKILPNSTYSSIQKMDISMDIKMEGDTANKSSIVALPKSIQMQTTSNSDIKTGNINIQNEIPFTMDVQTSAFKVMINGKENALKQPDIKRTFYGFYTPENHIKIDSVAGKKMDEKLKASMLQLMETMQSKIKFPDKPMKAGDTFVQDIPMELPIRGFMAKLISKTTFLLTNIENNKAYFDLKNVITLDMSGKQAIMDMTGDGNGKLVYDINASHSVSLLNNMNLIYSMTISNPQSKNKAMNGNIKMIMDRQTTITSGK